MTLALGLALRAATSAIAMDGPAPAPRGSAAPLRLDPLVESAVDRGVQFLLENQNEDGSYGAGVSARPIEVLASIPGSRNAFKLATTALCVMALRTSPLRRQECTLAAERGVAFLLERHRLGRPNNLELYNIWSMAYCLRLFGQELQRSVDEVRQAELMSASRDLVRRLQLYQTLDGGWTYLDFDVGSIRPSGSSMTFTSATVLISLHEARRGGVDVPPAMIDKGILTLRRGRKHDGAYVYGWYLEKQPGHGINTIKGSLGRTQVCNLAIHLLHHPEPGEDSAVDQDASAVDRDDLIQGLRDLYEHHRFLDIARKRPIPHEAWYSNSGYFYFYGLFYAGLVLDRLGPEDRRELWPPLRDMVLRTQEPDGSWWDYPLYGFHKFYGTAYAVLTLCRRL